MAADAASVPSSPLNGGADREEEGGTVPASEGEGYGFCAICLDKIALRETALVKGCEHAYCVTCILRWATYNEKHSCPQCKNPFDILHIFRSLDGSIHDYLLEESVCLLVKATWFVSLKFETKECVEYEQDEIDSYTYDDDGYDFEDVYFANSMVNLRIGNRRWGDGGYIRAGHKEARPINCDAGPSRPSKMDPPTDKTGRRAKRAMKREAADKAAAVKHEQHLQRLGRK